MLGGRRNLPIVVALLRRGSNKVTRSGGVTIFLGSGIKGRSGFSQLGDQKIENPPVRPVAWRQLNCKCYQYVFQAPTLALWLPKNLLRKGPTITMTLPYCISCRGLKIADWGAGNQSIVEWSPSMKRIPRKR